ncbi:hypothetical protein, variant 1 [Aphanomyces astaci]|uniref:Uncharacterized protein n=1 Tax=Aphanomyces astaci TaxID=112090 RepID=W4HAH2_APHAT|nr:hypothetical protein, variant 1 [Aphanomyces astaci]ETV89030.1 hypothetical protein, variant 1 [Aphanomyces astaci]|eukprot:XP_009821430.1 hypothetical protein, variant 1 [Aphanomyces astaci]
MEKRRHGDANEDSDSDITVMSSPMSPNEWESPCLMEPRLSTHPQKVHPIGEKHDDDSDDEATLILSQTSPTPSWCEESPERKGQGEAWTTDVHAGINHTLDYSSPHESVLTTDGDQRSHDRLSLKVTRTPRGTPAHTEGGGNVIYLVKDNGRPADKSFTSRWTSSKRLRIFHPPSPEDNINVPLELSPASQLCVLSQIGNLGASSTPWKQVSRPLPEKVPTEHVQPKEPRRSQNAYGKKVTAQAADWDTCSENAFDGDTSDGDMWAFEDLSDSDFD